MNQHFQGTVYGDKGYLSAISEELNQKGMKIICKERDNMKQKKKMTPEQKYYLKHRGLIESCFDEKFL